MATADKERRPRKLTLSPTRICDFLRCPRWFWYLYHQGYRRRPRGALTLGAALHRSMDAAHAPDRPSVEELVRRFQAGWSDAGFATREEADAHREAGQAMLQRYLTETVPEEVQPHCLLREKMLRMDRGFYVLQGRLDRVDQWPDGTLDVVDYKSGRSEVTEEQVRSDIGLMVYEMLVRSHFPLQPVRIAIHALRPNTRVTVERTDAERAETAAFIDGVAREIASATDWRGAETRSACEDCDFARFCPDVFRDEGS